MRGFTHRCIVARVKRRRYCRKLPIARSDVRFRQLARKAFIAIERFEQRRPVDRDVWWLRSAFGSAGLSHSPLSVLGADRSLFDGGHQPCRVCTWQETVEAGLELVAIDRLGGVILTASGPPIVLNFCP